MDDYGAMIQSGMNLVPDIQKQFQQVAQTQALLAQARYADSEAAAQHEKQVRADAFQQALSGSDGSPTAVSHLIMQFPEFADEIKKGWDVSDAASHESTLTALGEIYSAASSGDWKLAAKSAHARIEAQKASGQSDPAYDHMIGIIDKAAEGDVQSQKLAKTMLGSVIAAKTGPEHFGAVYGALKGGYTLGPGDVRVDDNGEPVAHSPFIQDADGGLHTWDSVMGGGQGGTPSAAPTSAPAGGPGGFESAVNTVLDNEGGYSPSDMNGAPVNFGINQGANPDVDVKNLTRDQAKQIYKERYWDKSGAESLPANLQTPYFDVYIRNPGIAKKALADAGGDPVKFMQNATAYFQSLAKKPKGAKYGKAWAARDAKNMAIAQGGSDADTPYYTGAPEPSGGGGLLLPGRKTDSYRVMTPTEVAAKGLPTTQSYKINEKTGDIQPISGTDAGGDGLDDATTSFYAQQILAGGQMPTLGMGKAAAAARQEIMKKVAQIAGAEGLSGKDLAVQIAHYKAGTETVKNLEKQAGTIEGNEQTALANGQQFLDRSRELPGQTGWTGINSIVQGVQRHAPVAGHDTIAAMDAAWNTFTTEYAKVVAGSPSGAGTLSDSARHEAQATMKGNYAYSQKVAAFKQMQADMANRMAAIKQTIADKYKGLGERAPGLGRVRGGEETSSLPKGAKVIGTYHGKRVIEVNGKRMVEN
jgi:hypothetical protein